VRTARRVVGADGPFGGDRLDVVEVLDGLVGDVDAEVVALGRGGGLLDGVVVVDEVRVPQLISAPRKP
jgi:hypothetical protein